MDLRAEIQNGGSDRERIWHSAELRPDDHGIRKPDDTMTFNPKAGTVIEAGDVMVVVGAAKSIKQLERVLSP